MIKTFARLGVEMVIADEVGSDLVGFADQQIPLQSVPAAAKRRELGELEEAVCAFHESYPVDGVLTTLDYLLPSVGRINDRLGLRGLTEAAGLACFDKVRQRDAFQAAGVPSTEYRLFRTLLDARTAAEELGFPLVLKPSDRTGSRGVIRVDTVEELSNAYATVTDQAWTGAYLAERYLVGREISVEAVTQGTETSLIAVNGKRLGPKPYFATVEIIVPGGFPSEVEEAAFQVVASALAALGVTDAVTHTELRLTDDGPRVLEVNGRIAGACIADMLADSTGTNLYQTQWDVLRGVEPTITRTARHHLSARTVVEGTGRLAAVDIGKLPRWDRTKHGRLQTFVAPGTVLSSVEHSNAIRGYAIGRGADVATASENAEALVQEIRLL